MEHRVAMRGEFGATSLANLLVTVEQGGGDAEVRLFTELGVGHVWFAAGQLADAELGGITGEPALGRLMAAEEGRFEVLLGGSRHPKRIEASVRQALQRQVARTAEWSRLLEQAPSLQARLWRADAIGAANRLSPARRAMIELCDGERSLADVIDASERDAVEALRELVELIDAGYVRAVPSRSPAAFSVDAAERAPVPEVPRAPAVPQFDPELTTALGNPIPEAAPEVPPATTRYSSRPGTVEVVAVRSSSAPPASGAARDGGMRASSSPPPAERRSRPDLGAMTQRDGSWIGVPPTPVVPRSRASKPIEPTRMLPPDATVSDDRFVGRYEVLCRLGRGGMGAVYLCRVTGEAGFRRLFALKVLRHRLRADPAAERAFLREAYVASRLHHPNAVAVVDAAVHARQPYLVLEYVEGSSLSELLRRSPDLRPPELLVSIVIDALEGLAAAHAVIDDDGRPLGLVHGDVSPENVLVGVDGAGRISDFGVSRLGVAGVIDDPREPLLSRPGYIAPERALGRAVLPASDVFSMGVVLWNALTGRELFRGTTAEETLENLLSLRIPAPSTVGLRPPRCLDEICLAALEREPRERLASAQTMADELRRIAGRNQLTAGRSDVSRWVRAHAARELEQRRLAVLDAARGAAARRDQGEPSLPRAETLPPPAVQTGATGAARGVAAPNRPGDDAAAEGAEPGVPAENGAATNESQPSTQPPPRRRGEASSSVAGSLRNGIVIVSVLLALGTIGLSILRPDMVARWFNLDIARRPIEPMPKNLLDVTPPNLEPDEPTTPTPLGDTNALPGVDASGIAPGASSPTEPPLAVPPAPQPIPRSDP